MHMRYISKWLMTPKFTVGLDIIMFLITLLLILLRFN